MNTQISKVCISLSYWVIICSGTLATYQPAQASDAQVCPVFEQLAVLSGASTTSLHGVPVKKISLYTNQDGSLSPITHQIDRKDKEDRYILDEEQYRESDSADFFLDANDELVIMKKVAGERLVYSSGITSQKELIEIEIKNSTSDQSTWVYAKISGEQGHLTDARQIFYDPDTDTVHNNLYKIGFSKKLPFFVENLSWNLGHAESWSTNVVDTMKIKHTAELFGFIPFERTGADYDSKLVDVKAGPLRIIRRTKNRVRILWMLKTPAIYVDYVMAPDGFIMDTIVDIPFKVGLFFSDAVTYNTIDWNNDPALPQMEIVYPDSSASLTINGKMSVEKNNFNQLTTDNLSVISRFGSMHVMIDIPDNFPIKPWLYLRDNIDEPDAPEKIPGQFGNLGFRTTGWENIDTDTHHMKFKICMKKGNQLNAAISD